jgi:alkylation response protein AidB-like acyl-CoA dehydrogenase
MADKAWGGEPFWGLGYDWDPDWVLTERQKELREKLIALCEQEMRANAKRSDDELLFPRRNFEILAENGFLSLIVPEEYGGLGENHVAFCMTCETLARYGCASTAMCYVMHTGAVATIMLRPTSELVDKYIRPLNDCKIGTLSYSDPETGSHFWYPFSSGAEKSNGGFKVRKKASWTTSGGFADFYVVQTTSPDFKGYDDLSVFVIDGEHVKSQPSLWRPTTRPSTRGSSSARRRCGTASRWARSTSPSAIRRASATSTSACEWPTTRRSRTTSARR